MNDSSLGRVIDAPLEVEQRADRPNVALPGPHPQQPDQFGPISLRRKLASLLDRPARATGSRVLPRHGVVREAGPPPRFSRHRPFLPAGWHVPRVHFVSHGVLPPSPLSGRQAIWQSLYRPRFHHRKIASYADISDALTNWF